MKFCILGIILLPVLGCCFWSATSIYFYRRSILFSPPVIHIFFMIAFIPDYLRTGKQDKLRDRHSNLTFWSGFFVYFINDIPGEMPDLRSRLSSLLISEARSSLHFLPGVSFRPHESSSRITSWTDMKFGPLITKQQAERFHLRKWTS